MVLRDSVVSIFALVFVKWGFTRWRMDQSKVYIDMFIGHYKLTGIEFGYWINISLGNSLVLRYWKENIRDISWSGSIIVIHAKKNLDKYTIDTWWLKKTISTFVFFLIFTSFYRVILMFLRVQHNLTNLRPKLIRNTDLLNKYIATRPQILATGKNLVLFHRLFCHFAPLNHRRSQRLLYTR